MAYTKYHAKYYANELIKQSASNDTDRISMSLFNACVNLNPHQVEAALFAFKSPLSKGVILADEVGLGKTIEAGLVLCQYWAERKRNILIICPASLRKQWSLELYEKFNIPNVILESKTYNEYVKNGVINPFGIKNKVIIMSYNFANAKQDEIREQKWDIAVLDEAHKLRNAYKPNNKVGQGIKFALKDTKKMLLTATPLQNSLLELYGLTSIISEEIFGDISSFRQQYVNSSTGLNDLRNRLNVFCQRTLRQDVTEYVPYTQRKPITFPFETTKVEQELYLGISKFLQKDDSFSIPNSQRTLITNVVRKLLASSSIAVIGTLESIKSRLIALKNKEISEDSLIEISIDEDTKELLEQDSEDIENDDTEIMRESKQYSDEEKAKKIQDEIDEIEKYIELAKSIKTDSKTVHLVEAINKGFEAMDVDASRKALIFTESRRTQEYLKNYLEQNGFNGKVLIFNGTNSDSESKKIYQEWLEKNKNSGRISGSKTADTRNAIIEKFRDDAEILIATESAAEGINLQFCSLVINYDLPWNPQRIEQRIGRCHRYGQKHDVVVLNFLNSSNETDKRVYYLLKDKFKLFEGVFGSSDKVLGALESGVDFEKKIMEIYRSCRTPKEISDAFDKLQAEMDEQIKAQMQLTKQNVLDNFDEDVHTRLKIKLDETREKLSRFEKLFWRTTETILSKNAEFDDKNLTFNLYTSPIQNANIGNYYLISKEKDKENIIGSYLYRLSHPLGEYVIDEAISTSTPDAEIEFDISNYQKKLSVIENLQGKSGYLILNKLNIKSFESADYLLFNAFCDDGTKLDQEICEKLFNISGKFKQQIVIPESINKELDLDAKRHINSTIDTNQNLNNSYLKGEIDRLNKWADDLIGNLDKEITDEKRKMRNYLKESSQATNNADYIEFQEKADACRRKVSKLRREIDEKEEEINFKRDDNIKKLKEQMKADIKTETLFKIRWKVV